jgi:hypothetical protein
VIFLYFIIGFVKVFNMVMVRVFSRVLEDLHVVVNLIVDVIIFH